MGDALQASDIILGPGALLTPAWRVELFQGEIQPVLHGKAPLDFLLDAKITLEPMAVMRITVGQPPPPPPA